MLSKNEKIALDEIAGHQGQNQDEITRKKIQKHLTDINDVISEDDIKNVNTDIHSEGFQSVEEKADSDDMVESETERKEIPASWKIIND